MLVLFAILIFVYNFAVPLLLATGSEASIAVELLYKAGFLWGAIGWLRSDKHRSAATQIYCHGLLIGSAWFVLIPYHLLKTRGVKGFLPLALLAGSFVGARTAGGVAYIILFGFPSGY